MVTVAAASVVGVLAASAAREAPVYGVVDIRLNRLPSSARYIEGAAWHVRLSSNSFGTIVNLFDAQTLTENRLTLRRVPGGKYRVTSYMRPCDGNCSLLDPPVDRCSGGVQVRAGKINRVIVDLRAPGKGCRIRVVA